MGAGPVQKLRREKQMDVIYERCCGVDVHKKKLVVCLFRGRQKEIREFGTMTDEILGMWEWLRDNECEMVAMESTGVYWKPVYNLLEEKGMSLMVANAQHIKAVPGRKTDVKDAEWIADLARHGLIRASFIPDREQREIREMTRYRNSLVEERAREINRVQSVLEGANIKLGSVVSDISGKSSMAILAAIAGGNTDPETLSSLAQGKLIEKVELLKRALYGSVGKHQMQMIAFQINHIQFLNKQIEQLDEEIKKRTKPAEREIELLDEMPGIARRSAERIIAETGHSLEQFRNADTFCSWAGIVPGCNESAGKRKTTTISKGNVHLKQVIVECAVSAIRSKNSFFYARYHKLAPRRGNKKAVIAVAHSMLIAIYHMLKNKQPFQDLGANYYMMLNADKIKDRNVKNLQKLGFEVSLTPTQA
jgi:transposase